MRNKAFQEKLEEVLEELRKLDDDLVVAAYLGHPELCELMSFGVYAANPEGGEVEEGDEVDCIVLNV